MVRFMSPVMSPILQQQQQQQSPPHSPVSPKQTLQTETIHAHIQQLSPPSLIEHDSSPESSLSTPPSPLKLSSPIPLGSSLRLLVTFPFGAAAAARRRDLYENSKQEASQEDDDDNDDLNLPHLTMTHDENPFLSCSASSSPCCPLVERRRTLEALLHNHQQQHHQQQQPNVATLTETQNHTDYVYHHHPQKSQPNKDADKNDDDDVDELKSEVSSISIDSIRRYEVMAMSDAAAAAAAAAAVNGEVPPESSPEVMNPTLPFEISIPTTKITSILPPIPLWLRLDDDDNNDGEEDSSSRKPRHRRSSSVGDAAAAFSDNAVVEEETTVVVTVQPSRTMIRPTLRKNQTVPTPSRTASSTRAMHYYWKSKENVSPTKQKSQRRLLLETCLEQRRQQQQMQQIQDSLLGDRPRRSDALSPNGASIITIGSIVGQSSLSLALTPTLSSSTLTSQKSGENDDALFSDQLENHHRRKPSTLTFLSNMATTPVRRLLPTDQHNNKVDLRRAKGCLT